MGYSVQFDVIGTISVVEPCSVKLNADSVERISTLSVWVQKRF
jgi:hypothetical protein